MVEEAGVPEENPRPRASNWLTLSLAAARLPMVGGSLRVLRIPPPLKLVAMI